MEIYRDFQELLELFNAGKIEYVIVGGYALAFHGAPRYTGDIDILVRATPDNAERVLKAMHEYGFKPPELRQEDFTRPDQIVQIGVPPIRVDIVTSIDGVSWEDADKGKVLGKYGSLDVFYLGRKEFIANKRSTGRAKDLADIEAIEKRHE